MPSELYTEAPNTVTPFPQPPIAAALTRAAVHEQRNAVLVLRYAQAICDDVRTTFKNLPLIDLRQAPLSEQEWCLTLARRLVRQKDALQDGTAPPTHGEIDRVVHDARVRERRSTIRDDADRLDHDMDIWTRSRPYGGRYVETTTCKRCGAQAELEPAELTVSLAKALREPCAKAPQEVR